MKQYKKLRYFQHLRLNYSMSPLQLNNLLCVRLKAENKREYRV